MIPQSYIDYYGDQTRWFVGVVTDVKDPLQLGRVKVRIFGVHSESVSDVPDSSLPWAQTVIPVTEGGSSGLGATIGIQVKAQVFGIFLDGKSSQLPLVVGSIPKIETGGVKYNVEVNPNKVGKVDVINGVETATTLSPDKDLLTGNTNVERAYNYFISEEGGRFTPIQAAGMIGNFIQESGTLPGKDINPHVVSSFQGEGSAGIAQWNPAPAAGARLTKLKEFAAKRNLPWNSVRAQVEWTKFELNTLPYLGLRPLRAAKDVNEATEVFCFKFERPNVKYAHLEQRQAYAREILEKFA